MILTGMRLLPRLPEGGRVSLFRPCAIDVDHVGSKIAATWKRPSGCRLRRLATRRPPGPPARLLRQIQLRQIQAVFESRQGRLEVLKRRLGFVSGSADRSKPHNPLALFLHDNPSAFDQLAGALNLLRLVHAGLLRAQTSGASATGRRRPRSMSRVATPTGVPRNTLGWLEAECSADLRRRRARFSTSTSEGCAIRVSMLRAGARPPPDNMSHCKLVIERAGRSICSTGSSFSTRRTRSFA